MNINTPHMGQEVIKKLNELHISKAEFSRQLNMKQQNLKGILTRRDISVDKLVKMSQALSFNFFSLYYDTDNFHPSRINQNGEYNSASINGSIVNYNDCPNSSGSKTESAVLKEKVKSLLNILVAKQETIDVIKSSIKS